MSNVLTILCLVLVGVAAFFFGTIYAVCHALTSMRSGALRVFTARGKHRPIAVTPPETDPPSKKTYRVCRNERCRHVEHRPARYCSQCGTKLDGKSEETGFAERSSIVYDR